MRVARPLAPLLQPRRPVRKALVVPGAVGHSETARTGLRGDRAVRMRGRRQHACRRAVVAGLLVGAFSITAPVAQTGPTWPGEVEAPSSGASWRSSAVL